MNNPSPLLPQGAKPPREKSSLYFKVLMILTVHVVVIGGMLLQGCKDTGKDQAKTDGAAVAASDTTAMASTNSNMTTTGASVPTDVPPTVNPNIKDAYAGTAATAAPATPTLPSAVGMVPPPKSPDLSAPGESREYAIARGDTMGSIARKNGLSLKTLMEANPGVEARKLKIGQKVQIPAASAAMAATTTTGAAAGAATEAAAGEGSVYVVKSGDMLLRIARSHGTSVKKIMAMNDLKSSSIRAGQKLKMPAPRATSIEPAATPASASAVPPVTTTPARSSAIAPAAVAPVAAN
jgi:N-acetylmuramoyl-L-alanine amidase